MFSKAKLIVTERTKRHTARSASRLTRYSLAITARYRTSSRPATPSIPALVAAEAAATNARAMSVVIENSDDNIDKACQAVLAHTNAIHAANWVRSCTGEVHSGNRHLYTDIFADIIVDLNRFHGKMYEQCNFPVEQYIHQNELYLKLMVTAAKNHDEVYRCSDSHPVSAKSLQPCSASNLCIVDRAKDAMVAFAELVRVAMIYHQFVEDSCCTGNPSEGM